MIYEQLKSIAMHTLLNRSCVIFFACITLVCITLGCSPSADNESDSGLDQTALPVVRGSQLTAFVRKSELPVLVEFGVDYNCPRCQQVRSDVIALAENLDQRVNVVRVDFNSNATMVAQLGGTICPTYVLFQNGEPVLTRSFPISIDLLESELEPLTDR